jgi:type VI secretion system Hcp family effector
MNNISKIMRILMLGICLSFCLSAWAENNAYMTIDVEELGLLPGGVVIAGYEDSFLISEMHHLFTRTNSTAHEPLIVTTPFAKGTPRLLETLDRNLNINPMEIAFTRLDPNSGQLETYYTVRLNNAKLVALEPIMHDNNRPENTSHPAATRLRFTYTSITHTWLPGGVVPYTADVDP